MHVAADDHSRLAHPEVLPNDRAVDAVAFLHRTAVWCREQGITVEVVLTDNGAADRSHRWR